MTAKRFYYAHGIVWDSEKPNGLNGIAINDLDRGLKVVDWLNEQHETIQRLKSNIDELLSVDIEEELLKENEQLKQRNDRQAKQLDNLYNLIEKEDWKTLTGIIQEFQECEEQLQSEWGNYGDVE